MTSDDFEAIKRRAEKGLGPDEGGHQQALEDIRVLIAEVERCWTMETTARMIRQFAGVSERSYFGPLEET